MREARTGPVELKRDLGTWAASSIVVGTVIGSGIFLVPHDMVAAVGTPALVFAVWIFGGLLTLAGSLSYAELAAALPEAGGEYAYLREAYGPLWGFLYSWTQMWVAKSGSIATLATGFAIYLTAFFPALDGVVWHAPGNTGLEIRYGQLFAIALILALAWLNYYGVKLGGEVQTAITVLKVALIAAIVVVGFAFGTAHAAPRPGAPLAHWAGFSVALVAALWAYDGWNNVTMV
ncbi:MAG: amino acid permease, partial [Bryobacteraceae bacterium]